MLMDELNLSSQERGSGQFHGIDEVSAQGREEGDLYGRDVGEHSPDHPGGEPDVCQEPPTTTPTTSDSSGTWWLLTC